MENSKLTDLMHDFDFVSRALDNEENKKIHIPALKNLILNFRKKWKGSGFYPYYLSLDAKFTKLYSDFQNNQI